jgi:hypothetical protein
MTVGALRDKRCKVCKGKFTPRSTLQVVCGVPCSIEHTRRLAEKKLRAEKREGRARMMTRRDWIKKAQVAFNRYIRLRDADKPCICCGRMADDKNLVTGSRWDAGHYRSTGSAPHLRFNEDNCHRQLVVCNRHGAGRAVDYRIGLIARIGLARVEALEADQTPRKYSIDDLKQIEASYKAKANHLNRAGSHAS